MSTVNSDIRRAQFFTFYSFKGGVGRSMALINTAAHLARSGRRVLAIDLDLEAPGISYLFSGKDSATASSGFVDAIYELLHNPKHSSLLTNPATDAINQYSRSLDLKLLAQGADSGVIRIMPAGCLSEISEYQRRLTAIDFTRLYREGVGVRVLEHFKKLLIEANSFDYILIDSRTGLSTEAGIAVRDLADHLIVVMGLNHQNVTGTSDFLRLIAASEPRPKTLTVVLSPMPLGEDDLAGERIKIAESQLRQAWSGELTASVGVLQIPYHPRLSLQENPHIARLTTQPLTQAYSLLEKHVRTHAGDTIEAYSQEAQKLINDGKWADSLRPLEQLKQFRAPAARFLLQNVIKEHLGERAFDPFVRMLSDFAEKDADVSLTCGSHYSKSKRYSQAERIVRKFLRGHKHFPMVWERVATWWFRDARRLDRADSIFCEALTYIGDDADFVGTYAMFLWHTCNDAAKAEPFYLKSLELEPSNVRLIGNFALFVWTALGDFQRAEKFFLQALQIDPEDGNVFSNYAEMLLAFGRLKLAKTHLQNAWSFRANEHDFVKLEILFRAGLYALIVKQSDNLMLKQLASVLKKDFEGEFVTFDRLLSMIAPQLSVADNELYRGIADVLSRKRRVSSLRAFPRWKGARPISFRNELFEEG